MPAFAAAQLVSELVGAELEADLVFHQVRDVEAEDLEVRGEAREADAAANRAKFGRPKSERQLSDAERAHNQKIVWHDHVTKIHIVTVAGA